MIPTTASDRSVDKGSFRIADKLPGRLEAYSRARGILYGSVLGDSIGEPVEKLSLSQIRRKFGPAGIRGPIGCAPIESDSIMTVAVAEALVESGRSSLSTLMDSVARHFCANAFGDVCRRGSTRLAAGHSWQTSGDREAQGCGSTLRAGPIGFYFQNDERRLREVAHAIGICTHAHPSADAACIGLAYMVKLALDGVLPREYPRRAIRFLAGVTPEFSERMLLVERLARRPAEAAHISQIGQGHRGIEALSLALYFLIRHPASFGDAVCAAANNSGHSDAVASIAGTLAGAYNGVGGLPRPWFRALPLDDKRRLNRLGKFLTLTR